MSSFTGKSAIVTGATSGIGRAAALELVRRGARVLLVGRTESALSEAAVAAGGAPGQVLTCAADITADDAANRIVSTAVGAFGGIDVLVNAAGVIATGTIEATSDEKWDSMMAVNVRAPFRLMRAAVPHLKERKGTVVNVSSVNGLRAFAGVLAYNVSKAAMDHLTRCAALEMAPFGVRVNCVNPGVTITNLHKRGGMDETQYAAFLAAVEGDSSTRPPRSARGSGRGDRVSGLRRSGLDDRGNHSGRRGKALDLPQIVDVVVSHWSLVVSGPTNRPTDQRPTTNATNDYVLAFVPSTNRSPSRSPRTRTNRQPPASSAGVASKAGPVAPRPIMAARPEAGSALMTSTRPPGWRMRMASRMVAVCVLVSVREN